MQRVGDRLLQGAAECFGTYRYRLLDSGRLDAISLPGGRIYVTRGLFAKLVSDDLVAAALAHEMAHLTAEDHFKSRPRDAAGALEKEVLADRRAARYLALAGFSQSALGTLIRLIGEGQPTGWVDVRLASYTNVPRATDNIDIQAPSG